MDKKILNEQLNRLNTPCKVYAFDSLESTNTTAKEFVRNGAEEFTLIITDYQTKGRGRMGRSFYSPDKSGIYLSIITRPKFKSEDVLLITPATAVGVSNALINSFGCQAQIKWVNDIYINNLKVCGILTESALKADGFAKYAVIGIGINMTSPAEGFPKELSGIAGAVFSSAPPCSREEFAATIISNVIKVYKDLPKTDFVSTYRSRSYLTDKTVTLHNGKAAIVRSIGDRCELIVEHADKTLERITSSEVSVKLSSQSNISE